MNVTVKLFSALRDHLPPGSEGGARAAEFGDGAKVGDIIERFGIPDEGALIILVNSSHATPETRLEEGDVVAIFPPVAGG